VLKYGALCIYVLSSARRKEEKVKKAKEEDMLQMQEAWTLH
jgi:hypothetical protein